MLGNGHAGVREAVRGNGPADKAGTARRIDFTTYISAVMRTFTGAHPDWLTVIQSPAYALDLNPAEDAWANMKNGLGNLAAPDVSDLAAIVKTGSRASSTGPGSSADSSPRPDSPSNPNRRSLRPWSFSLCISSTVTSRTRSTCKSTSI